MRSFSFEISMKSLDSWFDLTICSWFASNFLGYCPRVECSLLFWIHFASEVFVVWLKFDLLLPGFGELFVITLCCWLAFFLITFHFFNFTVVTSCHVSFSVVHTLRFIWALICFVTCVVFFSTISANFFSSASCFCVSVFLALKVYHGPVLVLVYSGIWRLSEDIDSLWLFLQVEGKKYCGSVRVLWLDETRSNCIFDGWERFLRVILNSSFILHSNFLISDNRFSWRMGLTLENIPFLLSVVSSSTFWLPFSLKKLRSLKGLTSLLVSSRNSI